MLVLISLACTHSTPPDERPTLAARFGDLPFLAPIDAPPTVALLAGGEFDTRASTCGGCHTEHYRDWGQSTHADAVHDVQFLAELAKPDQPRWLCLNCHAPTAPQRADLITPDTRLASADSILTLATTPNPDYDPVRTGEGVTCASCHVRRDTDGAGTVVGPRGSGRAPHRVRHDAAALETVCVTCHSPGADIVISPTFPCWFATADEVAAGPSAGTPCVACHMPQADRAVIADGPLVTVRRHTWAGSGIAKTPAGLTTAAERGFISGLDVVLAPLAITLTNARAGHRLPTGDPERFLLVEATLRDHAGTVLAADSYRIGQTWDWGDAATGRAARRTDDNRLGPGEVRVWTPRLAGGVGTMAVRVSSVRLTEENRAEMARVTLDAELQALWPELPAALAAPMAVYPREIVVFEGEVRRGPT